MRVCSSCKESKDDSGFYKKGKRLQSMCKPCFNSYCTERWRQRKIDAVAHKGGVCEDCKQVYHYAVFDFHHFDPTQKEFNWTKMKLRSEESLKRELDKCVLLCANCHRLRHTQD